MSHFGIFNWFHSFWAQSRLSTLFRFVKHVRFLHWFFQGFLATHFPRRIDSGYFREWGAKLKLDWGLCGLSQLVRWWRLCHLSKSGCQGRDSHHTGQKWWNREGWNSQSSIHRVILRSYGVYHGGSKNCGASKRSIQKEVTFRYFGGISRSCDARYWGTTFGELHWIHQKVPEPNFVPLRSVKIC